MAKADAQAGCPRHGQLELFKESPLTFAWLPYAFEVLLHWLFALGSRWVFRKAPERAKQHRSDFRERRRQQAIPRLASIIQDAGCSHAEKRHAVETLGLVVNQTFHYAADPEGAGGRLAPGGGTVACPSRGDYGADAI
jgi:hypothetical protein